jgi:HEPN domain-containing protein
VLTPEQSEAHLNNFALRCFRDIADGDYIAARMAYRADLIPQALWASQQALEKYLKSILLFRRIECRKATHSLGKLLVNLEGHFPLTLSREVREFLHYIDVYGLDRYFTFPYQVQGLEIPKLDRAVWELRRYCIPRYSGKTARGASIAELDIKRIEEAVNQPPTTFQTLLPGLLDAIIAKRDHPARPALVWKNLFFGKRIRNTVQMKQGFQAANSPLALYPEITDEVRKYVFLPKDFTA